MGATHTYRYIKVPSKPTVSFTVVKYAGTVGSSRQGFTFTVPSENMNDLLCLFYGTYNVGDKIITGDKIPLSIFTMNGNILLYFSVTPYKVTISDNTVTFPTGGTPNTQMYLIKIG